MALVRVEVLPDVLLTCTTHALTTETEEVMGLLLGNIRWENGAAVSRIWRVMPQIRTDRRKDRVEPSHEQLSYCIGVADKLTQMTGVDTKIVGWYHSHPNITVQPSHVDLKTQAQHQALDEGFVGLIFSCFNKDQKLHCTAFQSLPGGEKDEVSPISIEHEDPDIRKALQMSLEDSQLGQAVASCSWQHKEVPLVVLKPDGDWERSLTDMVQLQKMLFFEEKQEYDEAMESGTRCMAQSGSNDGTSLAALHHGSVYLQSLTRLMDTVLVPALNTVKQSIAQNNFRVEQLDAELNSMRVTARGIEATNFLHDAGGGLVEKTADLSLGAGHQNAAAHVLDRVTEAEYLMKVGHMENTRHEMPRSQDLVEPPVIVTAPGWGNGSAGPPPGFSQPRIHPPILGLGIDPPVGQGSIDIEHERAVMALQNPMGSRAEDLRSTMDFGDPLLPGHRITGSDFSQNSLVFHHASDSTMLPGQPSSLPQNTVPPGNRLVSSHGAASGASPWGSFDDRGGGASNMGAGMLSRNFNAGLLGSQALGSMPTDRTLANHAAPLFSNGPAPLGQSMAPLDQVQSHALAPGVSRQSVPLNTLGPDSGGVHSQRQPLRVGASYDLASHHQVRLHAEHGSDRGLGLSNPFEELNPIGQMSNGLSARGRSAGASTTPGHHWHPDHDQELRYFKADTSISGIDAPGFLSHGQGRSDSLSSPSMDAGLWRERSRDGFGGRMPTMLGEGRRGSGRARHPGKGGLHGRKSIKSRGSGHGGDSRKSRELNIERRT